MAIRKGNRPGQGRKKQPPELHVLKGTHREDRHGPVAAVLPIRGERPTCPDYLLEFDPDCLGYWDAVCDRMERDGLGYVAAAVSLEAFVAVYANWRKVLKAQAKSAIVLARTEHRKGLNEKGQEIIEKVVEFKRNPITVELRHHTEQLVRLASELGLTPASRARLMADLNIGNVRREGGVQRRIRG
jgi:P27 family predicted phage terminase small subunit